MPVSRDLGIDLAASLVELYRGVEQRLAVDLARDLANGIDSPDWAERKLAALATIRRRTEAVLARLDNQVADEVTQALVMAYYRGGAEGLREIARQQHTTVERLALGNKAPLMARLAALAGKRGDALRSELDRLRTDLPGLDAIQRLAFSLTSKLRGTHLRILRWDQDVYRSVVAETSLVDVLAGVKTRRRAAQTTWERFLSRGVTGFVDKSGRPWELASYVEMATRTGTAQAAVEGHLDRLADAGIDLAIVSNAPQECQRCRPWEGKVLARRGHAGTVQVRHATQDKTITVTVTGTVNQATAAGLMHPNCRHSLSAYLPGVTTSPTHTADPAGDKARQRLRALERKVRKAKLNAAAAIDPAAAAAHRAAVRDLQAQIREHVADTGLHRQRPREQIGTAR